MMAKFYRGKFMIKIINAVLLSVSSSMGVAAVSIPETLLPPLGHHQTLRAHAKGDQIYLCNTVNKAYHWTIQAPDALLLNEHGERIGKHYQGPIWEYHEGSQVQGKILQRQTVTPNDLSWLLVEIIHHRGHSDFSHTRFINRINTQAGLPPVTGCDSNHLGAEKRVPYQADYIFYTTD